MKKIAVLITLFFGLQLASQAQVYQRVYNSFDDAAEQSDWTLYRRGDLVGMYFWTFTNVNAYTNPSSLYHGYPVGGTNATDDWMVHKGMLMPHGGRIDSIRHNFSGFGAPGAGDTVAIYVLVGSPDPSLASAKILLHDFRDSTYQGGGNWHKTENIAIPASSDSCYIAFRYNTVVNWLDVQFDNVSISSLQFAGIDKHTNLDITVFPNPSNGIINIHTEYIKPIHIDVFDLTGKKMFSQATTSNHALELNLPNGIYYYRLSDANGFVLKTDKILFANAQGF